MKPKISVIIGEKNSQEFIKECITAVMNQDFKDFELIVVDDYSNDSTKQKIRELQKKHSFKLIELKKHSGISKARNTGIKEALGEFIAFTDADCIPEKKWLNELMNGFNEKTVSVGGPNLVPKHGDKNQKIFDELLQLIACIGSNYVKHSDKIIETHHNPSCNSVYRKNILMKMNGFNEKLSSNEDAELDFRIKKQQKKIRFNPKAIVFHHRKNSIKKIFFQAFWFGLGRMQAIKMHSGMADWFRIIPLITVSFIALLFFAGIFFGFQFFLYFLTALFLVFALISFTAVIKFKRFTIKYFVFLVSWFFGYGSGMLKGVFK